MNDDRIFRPDHILSNSLLMAVEMKRRNVQIDKPHRVLFFKTNIFFSPFLSMLTS